jgi:DNA (cytosine-5)-methyltransferase 1
MRVVKDLLPKVFVLENVHGIAYSGKEEGFLLLTRITDQINKRHRTRYSLSWQVLNAADYGVPQHRKRFFLVGHREGETFHFPPPSHGEPDAGGTDTPLLPAPDPHVTAWDAIGGQKLQAPGEDLRMRGR